MKHNQLCIILSYKETDCIMKGHGSEGGFLSNVTILKKTERRDHKEHCLNYKNELTMMVGVN
jgi:hypothetical protein